MVGMAAGATLRGAADVYEWLVRRRREDVGPDTVMDAIRSACGSVPLGGADLSRAVAARKEPSSISASSDPDDMFWHIVLAQCELPASVDVTQRKSALQALAKTLVTPVAATATTKTASDNDSTDDSAQPRVRCTWQTAATIRDQYYAARRVFFAVRIELLRVALFVAPEDHPGFDVADEVVDELLADGLLDALVDEVAGRAHAAAHRPDFFSLPNQSEEHAPHQLAAQQAWELQLLEETALLRHLLLLALYASKDKVDVSRAVATANAIHHWDDCVVPDVFASSTLALPAARDCVSEAAHFGVLVVVRMLHLARMQPLSLDSWKVARKWSRTAFGSSDSADDAVPLAESSVGVLALAWAALLAYQRTHFGSSLPDARDVIDSALQDALATADRANSFFHLHALLRARTFGDADFPFVEPPAIATSAAWQLPQLARQSKASRLHRIRVSASLSTSSSASSVAVVQCVGADLLDDVLSPLGFLDSVADNASQLHAMATLVQPVLANAHVAAQTLEQLSCVDSVSVGSHSGLAALLATTKQQLPTSLRSCLELLTALSANVDGSSAPTTPILRYVLKELAKPLAVAAADDSTLLAPRLLPPDAYFTATADGVNHVECVRSFYYEDDQLMIPAGTTGELVERRANLDDDDDDKYVQWHVAAPLSSSAETSGNRTGNSLWDLVFATAETAVAGVQSGRTGDSDAIATLTAFLEWLVQATRTGDSTDVVDDIAHRWAEARLRAWWRARDLPALQDVLPLLVRNGVSLDMLECASREDLVAWGIRDRFVRDQVLAQLAPFRSETAPRACVPFATDGLAHLVRLLLGFLDSFLHADATSMDDGDSVDEGDNDDRSAMTTQFHFAIAVLAALSALTASDAGVRIVLEQLDSNGSSSDECVTLVLASARKLFACFERTTGYYSGVFAALDTAMHVVRACLALEACSVGDRDDDARIRVMATAARTWCVGAVEFALEILATYESWRFATRATKAALADRCFRVVLALLTARFAAPEASTAMLDGLQAALRKTFTTDVALTMKLLRAASSVVTIRQQHEQLDAHDDWIVKPPTMRPAAAAATTSSSDNAALYPLTFATALDASAELQQRDALAATALRLLDELLSGASDDAAACAHLLLTPIDDGTSSSSNKRSTRLNLVTLCGGYIVSAASRVDRTRVLVSLRLLTRASTVLERSRRDSASHSLAVLFASASDRTLVRAAVLRLLRTAARDDVAIGTELLALLSAWLAHQPGFLAFVLLDPAESTSPSTSSAASPTMPTGEPTALVVALIERFLVASEQLMEQATELFCYVLHLLVELWTGATRHNLALHQQLVAALRSSKAFWRDLTRALKIRMALTDDIDDITVSAIDSTAAAYVGRSSPFGSLARGYILALVSIEWHDCGASRSGRSHPLAAVLETFRTEELYAHWLRTFTRLDYAPTRFADVCHAVQPYVSVGAATSVDAIADVPLYARGLLCDATVLQWQLGVEHSRGAAGRNDDASALRLLERVQWCNLQAAYVHAQCFALRQWKVFMELCCFQSDVGHDVSSSRANSGTTPPSPSPASPAVNRFKRKESMIASPPSRSTASSSTSTVPPSPLVLGVGAATSNFAGDRTSFGMVHVLADILRARLRHDALDAVALAHVHDVVELLVSMLHHQLQLVVTKTRDPKLSQLRPRSATSRLTVAASLALLRVVEQTLESVDAAVAKRARDNDGDALMDAGAGRAGATDSCTVLAKQLIGGVAGDARAIALRTALLTAALLLVRHVVTVLETRDGVGASSASAADPHDSAILQVKLLHHCMRTLELCDDSVGGKDDNNDRAALFQVSWCVFQDVVDGFVHATAASTTRRVRLDHVVTLRPLVALLEHEQTGLAALVHVLMRRFRSRGNDSADATRKASQQQALQVLTGLATAVASASNRDLWRRVLVDSATRELPLLQLLATEFVPLLRAQMDREDAATGCHGYVAITTTLSNTVGNANSVGSSYERSVAHATWCALLRFAAGLLLLLAPTASVNAIDIDNDDDAPAAVWQFLAATEPLMLAALAPQTRLTTAQLHEQTSTLFVLNAVSATPALKRQWQRGLPRSSALLLEQTRLTLRRAGVLLGSALTETTRQSRRARPTTSVVGLAATQPTSTFAHQTLLHEHLRAVEANEKRHVMTFHAAAERALVDVVRQSAALLLKWTPELASRTAVVVLDGKRCVDTETLVPLLALVTPSQAQSMSVAPSLGHVCIAIDFVIDELDKSDTSSDKSDITSDHAATLGNTANTCALLVLKTLALHVEQFEYPQRDLEALHAFFTRVRERVEQGGQVLQVHVDLALFELMERVVGSLVA